MIGNLALSKSHFPMLVIYTKSQQLVVINKPEDIKPLIEFVVVRTKYNLNVEDDSHECDPPEPDYYDY